MAALSLKDMLRKRVLDDMIRAVQPATKWKLLVVDTKSGKLLNAICKSHEILEENITTIEEMNTKRQPFANYEAIYFITPSEASVDKLIGDFSGDKPLYAAAHLFFVASLDDNLFGKLKKSGTTKYIKTMREMNIDFIAFEQLIFTLDQPNSLYPLFNPISPNHQVTELQKISTRLVSLCVTLGEFPYIRYYLPPGATTSPSQKLATLLQDQLEQLSKVDDSFPPKSDFRKPILLILDRTFDMISPLIHEFTYQAMMADLLLVDAASKYSATAQTDANAAAATYAMLDESDSIWHTIRHRHFAEAVDYIRDNFTKFLSENKAAASALGQVDGPKGIEGLKHMKDTLSALPQFQEMKGKFAVHINICQECKSIFEKRRLDLVGMVEQDLATGETADGAQLRNAMLDLVPVLDNKHTSSYDKLRALMIYIISMEGIQDVERRRLLETAKLNVEEIQAITNLSFFRVQLSQDGKTKPKDKDRYSYWGSHKIEKKKKKSKTSEDVPYDLSRFFPLVKRLVEDQIANAVPKETFPWVKEPSQEELGITSIVQKMFRFTSNGLVPPDPKYPNSLRTTRASWVTKRPQKPGGNTTADGKQVDDLRRNGSRIIVFVLGGLTYSELRSAYELTRENQREVLMGSTFVYHPCQFIDMIKELHKNEVPQATLSSPTQITMEEPVEKEKKGLLFGRKK